MCQLVGTLVSIMFEFVRNADWEEVRASWKGREETVWRAHYLERGFGTWESWREPYVRDFGLAGRTWTIETISDALSAVPEFYVGSFKGWQKYYPEGKMIATFADIARHPEIRDNTGVQYWLNHVPEKTRLMLFRCGEEIVVRDGTHRCVAMAILRTDDLEFSCEVEAAIAEFGKNEHDLFLKAVDQQQAKHVDPD